MVSCDPDCTEQLPLEEIAQLSPAADKNRHERHLSVLRLLQRRDRELTDIFNDLLHSTAVRQLACMQSHDLLSEVAIGLFISETHGAVQITLGE